MTFFKKISPPYIVLFFSLLVVGILTFFNAFSGGELSLYDLRFRLRAPLRVSPDILIIEISDDTLANLGSWPIPRDYHSGLLDILREFRVKSVVFDILFSEPTFYDKVFSSSIKAIGNVFLPLALDLQPAKKGYPYRAEKILADIVPLLKSSVKGFGQINTLVDSDGKRRRIPLFVEYKGEFIPNLALRALADYLNLDITKIKFKKKKVIVDNKLTIPLAEDYSFLVNYPASWKNSFKHISYFEVLKAYADLKEGRRPSLDLSLLRDKVCFIGLTATGTSDFSPTPLENLYPMVGLQASVFNSILNKKFIVPGGGSFNLLVNTVIFLLSLIISLKFKPLSSFLYNLALGLVYFLLNTLVFVGAGLWINLFLPLVIIGFVYVGITLFRILQEVRRRELLEKELDIARRIQESFLPLKLEEIPSLKIAAFFKPAKFVAGDLYDLIRLDEEKLGIFIGDVSGKGVPASLIMAQTVSLFRVFAKDKTSPSGVLTKLNKELAKVLEGRFVTAFYLVLDTKEKKIIGSSAGHSPVIYYNSQEKKVLELEFSSGPPLGISEFLEYEEEKFPLNPKGRFLLYTDGLTEAKNKKSEEFGLERVKEIILNYPDLDLQGLVDKLKEECFNFYRGMPQHDDITIILGEVE